MTDRELLADLLDSSVVSARKRLKETGQIENKDVIPLVLHDYHGRFDSIDKRFDQMDEEFATLINEVDEGFADTLTKNEFYTHMETVDHRLVGISNLLSTNMTGIIGRMDTLEKGLNSQMTFIRWMIPISIAVVGIMVKFG